MQHFWTNTIWYLGLGITTIIELLYVLTKANNRKLMFAFFLTFAGITYFLEIPMIVIYKAYDYFPMIFEHISRLDDGVIGNVFSQFSIAATALLLSFLIVKPYWYTICALLYGSIEELFLHLGIFQHYWYRTWMTVIGLSIYFWILHTLYRKTFQNPGRFIQYILIIFAVYVPYFHISWCFRLSGHPVYNRNIFSDEFLSVSFMHIMNFVLLSSIIMIAYFKRVAWKLHASIILFLYIVYFVMNKVNIIIYTEISLLLIFSTVEIFGMYFYVFAIDRLFDHIEGHAKG